MFLPPRAESDPTAGTRGPCGREAGDDGNESNIYPNISACSSNGGGSQYSHRPSIRTSSRSGCPFESMAPRCHDCLAFHLPFPYRPPCAPRNSTVSSDLLTALRLCHVSHRRWEVRTAALLVSCFFTFQLLLCSLFGLLAQWNRLSYARSNVSIMFPPLPVPPGTDHVRPATNGL